ncbi:MAG TPA: YukJ family protein [Longimicrobium sp.]|nr:YukJ family protein [Longimicrobium sp.]
MPIHDYGVLKGRILACRADRGHRSPHYEIHVRAAGEDARVSVNVRSYDRRRRDLLHRVDDDFRHPITRRLAVLKEGWHPVHPAPHGLALDYVRGGMVSRGQMRALAHDRPGANNDLNDHLDALVRAACDDPQVELYAFGSAWGPAPDEPDEVFGFRPGRGMHDVHLNQGNAHHDRHARHNGSWQDGALFLHLRREGRWVAVFLAFQSQSWHTDLRGFPRAHGSREHPLRCTGARYVDPTEPGAEDEREALHRRGAEDER